MTGQSAAVRVVCKGAWALGTACGQCDRCRDSAPVEIERLKKAVQNAEADANMYATAWQRELGKWMGPKRHHIDACVIGTENLVQAERSQRPWVDGLRRWQRDAADARTLGVPEPALPDYLPKAGVS